MAERRLTRGEAIRKHCIECSGGNRAEVRKCTVTKCHLYRYRMGTEIDESELKEVDAPKTKAKTKKASTTTKKKATTKNSVDAKKK